MSFSASGATLAADCFAVGRMNHDASTGITVSATSSEAPRAIITVSANGRNTWPAWPPTSPMGRNTAIVVRVELVTAPATSLTARVIDFRPNSP